MFSVFLVYLGKLYLQGGSAKASRSALLWHLDVAVLWGQTDSQKADLTLSSLCQTPWDLEMAYGSRGKSKTINSLTKNEY